MKTINFNTTVFFQLKLSMFLLKFQKFFKNKNQATFLAFRFGVKTFPRRYGQIRFGPNTIYKSSNCLLCPIYNNGRVCFFTLASGKQKI